MPSDCGAASGQKGWRVRCAMSSTGPIYTPPPRLGSVADSAATICLTGAVAGSTPQPSVARNVSARRVTWSGPEEVLCCPHFVIALGKSPPAAGTAIRVTLSAAPTAGPKRVTWPGYIHRTDEATVVQE